MDTQTAIIMVGAGIFNYYTLYKKNNIFGGIVFLLIGGTILMTADDETQRAIGMIVLLTSFIIMTYDFFTFRSNRRNRIKRKF